MERFTKQQIDEYRDAFIMFDKNNVGSIISSELRDMLKTIGYNPTDQLLENLSIVIDHDSNGLIDFSEFIDLIDKLETEEKAEYEARSAFNAFDFMGRGFISANDIVEALKFVMANRTEDEQNNVISLFKYDYNITIELGGESFGGERITSFFTVLYWKDFELDYGSIFI